MIKEFSKSQAVLSWPSLSGKVGMGLQQRRRTPQYRCLPMHITCQSFSIQIILMIVFLSCSLTYICDLCVLIYIADQCEPCFACSFTISFFIKPFILYTRYHCKGEHTSA